MRIAARRPRLRLALLLAVSGLALLACGSHKATKQDVIAQANQICESATASLRNVTSPADQSLRELARFYGRVAPIVQQESNDLQKMPRPAQDRATLERFLGAIAASAKQYTAAAAAARDGDRAALTAAGAAVRASPASQLATSYGMTGCASSGTGSS